MPMLANRPMKCLYKKTRIIGASGETAILVLCFDCSFRDSTVITVTAARCRKSTSSFPRFALSSLYCSNSLLLRASPGQARSLPPLLIAVNTPVTQKHHPPSPDNLIYCFKPVALRRNSKLNWYYISPRVSLYIFTLIYHHKGKQAAEYEYLESSRKQRVMGIEPT